MTIASESYLESRTKEILACLPKEDSQVVQSFIRSREQTAVDHNRSRTSTISDGLFYLGVFIVMAVLLGGGIWFTKSCWDATAWRDYAFSLQQTREDFQAQVLEGAGNCKRDLDICGKKIDIYEAELGIAKESQ